ncbi:MAG: undecaprenyl-diphosphate phosphatase [Actinobacteria bacterium]|nr:undecaprenyl-diphosphate phosphatase [Actinomycetota bacterium]
MISAIVWGLVQGLTEFLPISSSGHLVIVPAALSKLGMEIAQPDLAVTTFLHLGTLLAVIVYFRSDVARVFRSRHDPLGRRLLMLVLIGSLPAAIGLFVEEQVERFQQSVTNVGWALVGTGLILAFGHLRRQGERTLAAGRPRDALAVGLAQALAIIPGISRSGATISAGNGRRFVPAESARFAFLLGIPAITAAGVLQLPEVIGSDALWSHLAVGFLIAAVSGYVAIAWLLRMITRVGLAPFSVYCLTIGALTVVLL